MRISTSFSVVPALALILSTVVACDSERHQRGTGGEAEEGRAATGEGKGTLTIKGSDTMVILAQRWAEAYMKANPGVSVQVSGGGSGTGVAALINGTTDIANASREMKASEKKKVREKRGAAAHEVRVALDALAVYVHQDNPVESIGLEDLRKIYLGKIDNWKEVGGPDRSITLYGRENNSGTYVYFKDNVLDGMDFSGGTQTLPGTSAVINAVSKDPGGIGYGGIGYAEGVETVALAPEDGDAVEPTLDDAVGGDYPLTRFLHMYTAGEPEGGVEQFIAFVLSPEGQKVVEGAGYYPLPAEGGDDGKQAADTPSED
ncbi:MAG: phosphate ABC transporter substrate-binding protein [Myxococcota bacterium]